jgi:carboxyl-terminal processing protease
MEQKSTPTPAASSAPSAKRRSSWLRLPIYLLLAAAIFVAGVNVGNGRISFSSGAANKANASLPNTLDYSSVNQVYQSLKDNYDGKLNETQLLDGLKHGLAGAANDPYTVYFTPKEAKEFESQLNNSFSGIGAQLGQDSGSNLEIIAPISGSPAEKAGLKAGDKVVKINGESTSGMAVDKAVGKIRGEKGTKVTLQIVHEGGQPTDVVITRDEITMPSVTTKTLDGNIGYMAINSFAPDTAALAKKAADDFKKANVKGVVVDLRNDPGGLLDQAVSVASLWLPKGDTVLQEKTGGKVVDTYFAEGGDVLNDTPTVILTNDGSASAAEILAGALKDNKQAYIIGEKTYGKGVVQKLINFGDGSELKVTVASWYRPNGQNINKKGITPDKTIKLTEDDAKAGNDTQLQAAQAYLNK